MRAAEPPVDTRLFLQSDRFMKLRLRAVKMGGRPPQALPDRNRRWKEKKKDPLRIVVPFGCEERERVVYCQPTGLNPLCHRNDSVDRPHATFFLLFGSSLCRTFVFLGQEGTSLRESRPPARGSSSGKRTPPSQGPSSGRRAGSEGRSHSVSNSTSHSAALREWSTCQLRSLHLSLLPSYSRKNGSNLSHPESRFP